MSFIKAGGKLQNVSMKKDGSMLLQIVVENDLENKEDYYRLRQMIQRNLRFSLDSRVVTYKVPMNARTEKPITEYKVDATGVVSEVKPSGEQLEMPLEGVAAENVEIVEEKLEIDRDIIDAFILSGMAPVYDDMVYDFLEITRRLQEGETYVTMAKEQSMDSAVFTIMVDEYRSRIAPLAQKWDEWRTGKLKPAAVAKAATAESEQETVETDTETEEGEHEEEDSGTEDGDKEHADSDRTDADTDDELPEWMQDDAGGGATEEGSTDPEAGEPETATGSDAKKLEEYILEAAPTYPDIPFDFAALLYEKKRKNLTWVELAAEKQISSGTLQAAYAKYKARVKKEMSGGGAA